MNKSIKLFWEAHKAPLLLVLYIISPIDLVPEAFLGVFGLIDDFFVALILIALLIFRFGRWALRKLSPEETPNADTTETVATQA